MAIQLPPDHPKRRRPAPKRRTKAAPAVALPALREVVPADAYIFYGRKSTRESNRQVASLDQQREEVVRYMGREPWKEFTDSQSGTSFDRPKFQQMLGTCLANPQPRSAPKRLVMWDYCRFSREFDQDEATDLNEVLAHKGQLEAAGWLLDSVRTPYNDNFLVNFITVLMKFHQSRDFAKTISEGVKRGKRKWSATGHWLQGRPPYPAQRVDPHSGLVVHRGERATQATLLRAHPEWLKHWVFAAKLRLTGASYDAVAEALTAREAPTGEYQRHGWTGDYVQQMLTHPALIGKLVYHLEEGTVEVDARWDALVPEDLWLAVHRMASTEQQRRATWEKSPGRNGRDTLLEPVCAQCLAPYHSFSSKGVAYYRHMGLDRMTPAHRAKAEAAGCQVWTVPHERLNGRVRDLLRHERTSKDYRVELARAREACLNDRQGEEALEEAAKAAFEATERDYKRLARNLALVDDEDVVKDLGKQLARLKRELATKQEAWELARDAHARAADRWQEFEATVEETEAILQAWDRAPFVDKKRVMEWWVDVLLIVPKERPPKWKYAKRGRAALTARVYLRSNPDDPRLVELSQVDAVQGDGGSCVLGRSTTRSPQGATTNWFDLELVVS